MRLLGVLDVLIRSEPHLGEEWDPEAGEGALLELPFIWAKRIITGRVDIPTEGKVS